MSASAKAEVLRSRAGVLRSRAGEAGGDGLRGPGSGNEWPGARVRSDHLATFAEALEPCALPTRVNEDPDSGEHGLAGLILAVLELLRELLERQAIRRMDAGSLTEEEIERVGGGLQALEVKIRALQEHFGIEDLDLELGPLHLLDG